VRELLQALFLSALERPLAGFELEIARDRRPILGSLASRVFRHLARREPPTGPLRDPVFADFMVGLHPESHLVRLPRTLVAAIWPSSAPWPLRATTLLVPLAWIIALALIGLSLSRRLASLLQPIAIALLGLGLVQLTLAALTRRLSGAASGLLHAAVAVVALWFVGLSFHVDGVDPEAHNNTAIRLKSDEAQYHRKLGDGLLEKGDYDGAIAEYHEALRLRPDEPEAHNNLGVALGRKGQLDAAIAAYREALRLRPDEPEAHNNLGVALADKGDYDGAIAAYHAAIQLKPDEAEYRRNLGNTLGRKGDRDGANAANREAQSPASSAAILAGYVIDAETGEPLSGVTLIIQNWETMVGQSPTATTDSAGRFRFDNLRPSADVSQQVQLIARKPGYQASITNTTLGSTTLPIKLRPTTTSEHKR
jgi:Flp pilus assembly protein TadD